MTWNSSYAAGSTFAVQVTSGIPGAQQMTIDFANNNLNGKSKWRADDFRDYDTSRTRVCVTVGMMTTGYDCEDVLNVALARPIFSPTDFIQIKGRGTPGSLPSNTATGQAKELPKRMPLPFLTTSPTVSILKRILTTTKSCPCPKARPLKAMKKKATEVDVVGGRTILPTLRQDPMASVLRDEIGLFGMRIDREMYRERFAQQASEAVSADGALREAYDAENWPAVEERVRKLLFEKAQEFWNLPKLQEIYKTDRLPTLREILARVFGLIPGIPTRGQLADEAFEKYVATQPSNAVHSRELKVVFVAFLLDEACRHLLQEGKFAELRACDASLYNSLSQLSPQEREALIGYLQSQVPLKEFEQAI